MFWRRVGRPEPVSVRVYTQWFVPFPLSQLYHMGHSHTRVEVTTDEAALLTAIEANPGDDTPRLVFADYLDDQAGQETPRSEFIRLQCGQLPTVAKTFTCPGCFGLGTWRSGVNFDHMKRCATCKVCWEPGDLEDWSNVRQRELLTANRERWERVPCVKCGGKGDQGYGTGCKDCRGTGDMGGLSQRLMYANRTVGTEPTYPGFREPAHVIWERGFPVAMVPSLADCVERIHDGFPDDDGWQPTPWLRTVVRHHRGIEVVPLDQKPVLDEGGFEWYNLPDCLNGPEKGTYPTRQAAILTLGRAIAKFGRQAPA